MEEIFSRQSIESFKGNVFANILSTYPSLFMIVFLVYRVLLSMQNFNYHNLCKLSLSIIYRKRPTSHFIIHGTSTHSSNTWSSKVTSVIPHSMKALTKYALTEKPEALRYLSEHFIGSCEYDDIDYIKEKYNNNNSEGNVKFIPETNNIFKLTDDIWMRTITNSENTENDKSPMTIEKYTIELTSYTLLPNELTNFIEIITSDYLKKISETRKNKRYIYRLRSFVDNQPQWSETLFDTNRTFDNLHFDGKEEFEKQLNTFLEGEEWYKKHGHTYACGIALHGPPGTGKTSLIKAIAKKTNRHIIEIPLSKISNEEQLFDTYFCKKYNYNTNEELTFRDKIIILEDIDCQSHLLDRNDNNSKNANISFSLQHLQSLMPPELLENKNMQNFISSNKIGEIINNASSSPLTLDIMLNLLDGIRENTGRILILTTNHFDKLDPALTRPGRIDIVKHMNYVGIECIKNIYYEHTGEELQDDLLAPISDKKFSPCLIASIIRTNRNPDTFINELKKNI